MFNYLDEVYQAIDKESSALRASGKKGVLVGGVIFEKPPEVIFEGDRKTLEKMAEEWRARGGIATIHYALKPGLNDKLFRDSIYIGMEFELCLTSDEAEKAHETISSRVYKKDMNLYPRIFIESEIK